MIYKNIDLFQIHTSLPNKPAANQKLSTYISLITRSSFMSVILSLLKATKLRKGKIMSLKQTDSFEPESGTWRFDYKLMLMSPVFFWSLYFIFGLEITIRSREFIILFTVFHVFAAIISCITGFNTIRSKN